MGPAGIGTRRHVDSAVVASLGIGKQARHTNTSSIATTNGKDTSNNDATTVTMKYTRQQVEQSEKSEEFVRESIDVVVAKVDPVNPKSVTPEPLRSERKYSNIEMGEESFVSIVQRTTMIKWNHDDQVEDKNGDEAVDDTKWWENESQFLLSSHQLMEGRSLCDELLQIQSPNRDGNENGQGLNHKPLLSNYARIGPEDLKKDLEECQCLVYIGSINVTHDPYID
ncbi:NAC domain-containing protein 8 [Forsythia ovata]|uniref:NAC domain-containing protein 8 n=1 Tax=Forsythia ovata TaxID=205694 RepID=A0ABD1UEK6_9LAMI